MAVYNEIQVGRYVRFLQKFFGIKGRQPAPLQFSGELGAVFSLFHGVENRLLEGWDRYGTNSVTAAVAAQVSGFRLRNPAKSNVVAVVEKIVAVVSVADTLNLRIGAVVTDLTNLVATPNLDGRSSRVNSALQPSNAAPAAAFGLLASFITLAANISGDMLLDVDHGITVAPGNAIQVETVGVNETIRVSCIWRERALEESETLFQ